MPSNETLWRQINTAVHGDTPRKHVSIGIQSVASIRENLTKSLEGMKLALSIGALFIILVSILALSHTLKVEGFDSLINVAKLQNPYPSGPTRCQLCCYSGIDTCDPNDKCNC